MDTDAVVHIMDVEKQEYVCGYARNPDGNGTARAGKLHRMYPSLCPKTARYMEDYA